MEGLASVLMAAVNQGCGCKKVGWLWQFLKNKNGESCPHGLTLFFIEHLEATIGLLIGLSSISLRPVNREPGERAVGSDWMVEQSKHTKRLPVMFIILCRHGSWCTKTITIRT